MSLRRPLRLSLPVRRDQFPTLTTLSLMIGRPVVGSDGQRIGRVGDVVVRVGEPHPLVTGLVVGIGQRRAWLHIRDVAAITPRQVTLSSARFDLRDVERRPGEVMLTRDVLDHQLVDLHGVRVVRASDLYLANHERGWRLVGVDVSLPGFLRRALPPFARGRGVAGQVLDWAGIHSLADDEGAVQLAQSNAHLQTLSPADLADLIHDLGHSEAQELLEDLDLAGAADVLELLPDHEGAHLLGGHDVERAADLLAEMEPDEAADVLRELDDDHRSAVMEALESEERAELAALLDYDEDTAGGMMNPRVVAVSELATVAEAVRDLVAARAGGDPASFVVLVDADDRLVDDVTALELLAEPGARPVRELMGEPWPITVSPLDGLGEVVEAIRTNAGASVVVVDESGRPIGRILADDVVDSLSRSIERRWPWQAHPERG